MTQATAVLLGAFAGATIFLGLPVARMRGVPKAVQGFLNAFATGMNEKQYSITVTSGLLHRLEYKGWIKSEWGTSENNRRAKYYELSKNGRKQLEVETATWEKLTAAVAQVLGTA